MSCKKVQELLVDYLDQDLRKEEASFVQSHVAACHSCSKELRTLEQLSSVAPQAKVSPDDPFFEETRRHLFERIRESRPSREASFQRSPRRLWKPVLVPVTLSLLLVVGLQIHNRTQEGSARQDLAMMNELGEEETAGIYSEDPELLEEELAVVDEFLLLAQLDQAAGEESVQEDLELLHALGEGEGFQEEDIEAIEQELSLIDEGAVG